MSAEPRRITKSEVWTEWEGQVVNGLFPLRRFLGGSNHSAVFLTEYKAANVADVAIKFVPADAPPTDLVQWGAAATLSHPHLLRLFDVGRCQIDGRGFLFVVMEYADQTLAQVLAKRALSPDEVREMLVPTLDALAFLHRNHLLHGQLQPSNILVVGDQLKLASDTVRPIGNAISGMARTSPHDPPELKNGAASIAGDIWALGMTLVEALTQRTPPWPEDRAETTSLVASISAPFADTVRRCLSLTPAKRPTVAELETQYRRAPREPVTSVPPPPAPEAPRAATPPRKSTKRPLLIGAVVVALLIALAAWIGLRSSGTSQAQFQPPPLVDSVPADAAPAAAEPAVPEPVTQSADSNVEIATPAARPPDQSALPPADASLAALHEVTPDVPPAISARIRGHVRVTVRVLVDPAGNVVGQLLESPGPSRYFARLAGDAAEQWKFAPADTQQSRVWLLRFEFTRGAVTMSSNATQ
jgi:outer membrane biosynthesis protein TonB